MWVEGSKIKFLMVVSKCKRLLFLRDGWFK